MKLQSVRARLTLWNVGVLALALLVVMGVAVLGARKVMLSSVDRELRVRAERLEGLRPPGGPGFGGGGGFGRQGRRFDGPPPMDRPLTDGVPPPIPVPDSPYRPRVVTPTGRSLTTAVNDAPFDAEAVQERRFGFSTVHTDAGPLRVYTAALRTPVPNQDQAFVQFAYPLAEVHRAVAGLASAMLLVIPIGLGLAALGGWFLTQRALSPVGAIASAAEAIGEDNLSARLPKHGDDEFAQLAGTMNGMLERIEQGYVRQREAAEQQRRFTADASHELRTPLTVIRANTDLALKGTRTPEEYKRALAAIEGSAQTMSKLVEDLLLLARTDDGRLELRLEPIELGPWLEALAEGLAGSWAGDLQVRADAELTVVVDEHALARVLMNLVSNAARHTPPDGRIQISARRLEGQVEIAVSDSGTGIAPEHLPHLFERFYRADAARGSERGGSGLGLAIVKSLVEAHSGQVEVRSEPGAGTRVSVRLPAIA